MEYATNNLVETQQRTLGKKRISLNLFGDANHGYLLERRIEEPSMPASSIYIHLHDQSSVHVLAEHDYYRVEIGALYENIARAFNLAKPRVETSISPQFASDCASEQELVSLIVNACRRYGADQCFYHRFTVSDRTGEVQRHQVFVGGRPDWAQHYVDRHWHLNDPALAHALLHTGPLRSSSMHGLPASHWSIHQARLHGLSSNVYFPAHQRDDATIGLLHVGSSVAAPQGEATIWRNRRCLRGLAAEVLDWYIGRERSAAMKQWALNANELAALQLVVRGGNARHVANELEMDERSVYVLFSSINRKMDCPHIKTSANKAAKFISTNNQHIDNG